MSSACGIQAVEKQTAFACSRGACLPPKDTGTQCLPAREACHHSGAHLPLPCLTTSSALPAGYPCPLMFLANTPQSPLRKSSGWSCSGWLPGLPQLTGAAAAVWAASAILQTNIFPAWAPAASWHKCCDPDDLKTQCTRAEESRPAVIWLGSKAMVASLQHCTCPEQDP